jgi:hypothetical protein
MIQETEQKLEQLATIECSGCGGSGNVMRYLPDTDERVVDHPHRVCHGTGKKWWPLAWNVDAEILYTVEQCLGMLGSWEVRCNAHTYGDRGPTWRYIHELVRVAGRLIPMVDDRFLAAVECLWEAANENVSGS